MELETINKLYLELSQITTATTAREILLQKQLAEAKRNALGSHDVREPTAIGRAVNRAARDLPEGWEIRIDLERGAGAVHLTDPEGKETMIDGSGELFSDQINAAIDAAMGEPS